jgi:hypothetical protein
MIGFMGHFGKHPSFMIRSEGRAATGRLAADPVDLPEGAAFSDKLANQGEIHPLR